MRVGGAAQGVLLADDHAHLLRAHRGEQLARRRLELRARGDVVEERGTGEKQRAALGELERRRWRGAGPEALPKVTIIPKRLRQSSDSMKVSLPTAS